MKIPSKINDLLIRRTKYAEKLQNICSELDIWLVKNNINPDEACYLSGCEIYVNPVIAEDAVRRAILDK